MSALSISARLRMADAARFAFTDSALNCDGVLHRVVLDAAEGQLLRMALDYHNGIQLRAARTLGVNRNTLRKLMRKHGVRR